MSLLLRRLFRGGLVTIVPAACVFLLLADSPVPQPPAMWRGGPLGSLSICQLPSGEKVIWGLNYREPKPPGCRELGSAEVALAWHRPSGLLRRWVQPYEITVFCAPFSETPQNFAASIADREFVEKHATCMDSASLHRIAKEVGRGTPVIEGAGDPAYHGNTVRHYSGELIVWEAVAASAYRLALWGILGASLYLIVRWTRVELRKGRGDCEGCGYDLRGLPAGSPCPECGRSR